MYVSIHVLYFRLETQITTRYVLVLDRVGRNWSARMIWSIIDP